MGITQISLDRIGKYLKPNSNILIVGCQNLYDNDHYGQVADPYFQSLGHQVISIDIAACQGAVECDLRELYPFNPVNDQVWNHGTQEHIDGSLYIPFLNQHNACKIDGILIFENPATLSWPLHGYHYFTEDFYRYFAPACGYELLEVTREASMGNFVDGWNISSVMRKIDDRPFITEEQFNEIYAKHIRSK